MNKTQTKEKILNCGAELIHEKGFNNTGISEVLKLAGVPKGSFYFYFESKDDFGLALIDRYVELVRQIHRENGVHLEKEPDKRLFAFFDSLVEFMNRTGYRKGCPLGNLVQEMSDLNENFRTKLESVFTDGERFVRKCLKGAVETGVFRKDLDMEMLPGFLLNSYQGAVMMCKLHKSEEPYRQFRHYAESIIKE